MKIVIDTNVFVSSFFNPEGRPRKIINLWKSGKAILCFTEKILEEYLEVLMRLGLAGEPELKELLQLFTRKANMMFIGSTPELTLIKDDPDDNKFVECAVGAGAEFIISGDKHLLNLKTFREVQILTPTEFLNMTKSEN